MFLKVLQNSQKNIFSFFGVSLLIKLQAGNLKLSEATTGDVLGPTTLSKNTPTQALSWETCNYFKELLWMTTSKLYLKRESNIDVFLSILSVIQERLLVHDLQKTGFETAMRGSLFNKVASLTAWISLTVLEKDCSMGISLWILWNF